MRSSKEIHSTQLYTFCRGASAKGGRGIAPSWGDAAASGQRPAHIRGRGGAHKVRCVDLAAAAGPSVPHLVPVGSETPASPLGLHIERTLELSTSSDASSPRTSPFSASNRSALRSSYRNVSHAKSDKKEEDAGYAIPTADDAASDSDEPADPRTSVEQNRSQRVWYQELQHALALEDHERHRRLYALARDFVHASELYGKVIISEAFLPLAEKTIKPWESCPGVAGGTKVRPPL